MSKYRLISPEGEESLYGRDEAEELALKGYDFSEDSAVPILRDEDDGNGNTVQRLKRVPGYEAARVMREEPLKTRLLTEEETFSWEANRDYGDSWTSAGGAALAGAADGITLGLAGPVLEAAGFPVKEWREAYPMTYGSADFITSLASSILATGTTGVAGGAVAAGRMAKVTNALRGASRLTPTGILSRTAEGVIQGSMAKKAQKTLAKMGQEKLTKGQAYRIGLGARIKGTALEGGITGATYSLSEQDWGDPEEAAGNVLWSGGISAVIGTGLVGAPGLIKHGSIAAFDAAGALTGRAYISILDSKFSRKLDEEGRKAQKEYNSTEKLIDEMRSERAKHNADLYESFSEEGIEHRAAHERVMEQGRKLTDEMEKELEGVGDLEEILRSVDQTTVDADKALDIIGTGVPVGSELSAATTPDLLMRLLFITETVHRGTVQRNSPILRDIHDALDQLLKTDVMNRPTSDPTADLRMYDTLSETSGVEGPLVVSRYGNLIDQVAVWMDEIAGIADNGGFEMLRMLKQLESIEPGQPISSFLSYEEYEKMKEAVEHIAKNIVQSESFQKQKAAAFPDLEELGNHMRAWSSMDNQEKSAAFRFLKNWKEGAFQGPLMAAHEKEMLKEPVRKYSKGRLVPNDSRTDEDIVNEILLDSKDELKALDERSRTDPRTKKRSIVRGVKALLKRISGDDNFTELEHYELLRESGINGSMLRREGFIKRKDPADRSAKEMVDTEGRSTISQSRINKMKNEIAMSRAVEIAKKRAFEDAKKGQRKRKWRLEEGFLSKEFNTRVFNTLERIASEVNVREELLPADDPGKAGLARLRGLLTEVLTEDGPYRRPAAHEGSMFGALTQNKREFNAVQKKVKNKRDEFRATFMMQNDLGEWVIDKAKVQAHVGTPVGRTVEGVVEGHEGARNVEGFKRRQEIALDYYRYMRDAAKEIRERADMSGIGKAARDSLKEMEKRADDAVKELKKRGDAIEGDLAPALHHQDALNRETTANQLMSTHAAFPAAGGAVGATAGALAGFLTPIPGATMAGAAIGGAAGVAGGTATGFLVDEMLNGPLTQARLKALDVSVRKAREMHKFVVNNYWDAYSGRARQEMGPGHVSMKKIKRDFHFEGVNRSGKLNSYPRFLTLKSVAKLAGGRETPSDKEIDYEESGGGALTEREIMNIGETLSKLSENEEMMRDVYEASMPGLRVAPNMNRAAYKEYEKYITSLAESYPKGVKGGPLEEDIPPTKQQLYDWLDDAIVRENGLPEILDRASKGVLTRRAWDEFEDQYPRDAMNLRVDSLARMSDPDVARNMPYAQKVMWEIILPGLIDVRSGETARLQESFKQEENKQPAGGSGFNMMKNLEESGTMSGILRRE